MLLLAFFAFCLVSVQAKGNNRGVAVVEFFGAHEFALLKPDALRPLSSLDKCPNKSVRVQGTRSRRPCHVAGAAAPFLRPLAPAVVSTA